MLLSEKKTLLLLIVAGVAFLAFWQILSSNAFRPRAVLPLVHISLAPDKTSLAINETGDVNVVIQPASTGNKISGFDITFQTVGPLSIQSLGNPSVLGTGETSIFALVKKTTTRAFYTINLPDSQLPNGVLLPVRVTGISPGGQATLTADKSLTKITGNIAGGVYGLGEVETTTFSVSASAVTATPGVASPTPTKLTPTKTPTRPPTPTVGQTTPGISPSPTVRVCPTAPACDGEIIVDDLLSVASTCPVYACLTVTPQMTLTSAPSFSPTIPTQCPLKPKGDANCDGKVDLIDFEIWRKEYRGELTSKDADFNSDGKVDLIDFETWRRTYAGV